tara:strand:+ start:349 stop:624 length:276 start_codon:yes stop_codon:yes gene_type:complete
MKISKEQIKKIVKEVMYSPQGVPKMQTIGKAYILLRMDPSKNLQPHWLIGVYGSRKSAEAASLVYIEKEQDGHVKYSIKEKDILELVDNRL